MRLLTLIMAALGLGAAVLPCAAGAQGERDFVFTDEEGHMVLRFAGSGSGGLDADQMHEIINVSLSTMVHDKLQADIAFEAEPADPAWADAMVPRIERHVLDGRLELSALEVECRSLSCRLILEHSSTPSVAQHQALMGDVQRLIRAFVDSDGSFAPVFLIAAYYQEPAPPLLKVYLRRTSPAAAGS